MFSKVAHFTENGNQIRTLTVFWEALERTKQVQHTFGCKTEDCVAIEARNDFTE